MGGGWGWGRRGDRRTTFANWVEEDVTDGGGGGAMPDSELSGSFMAKPLAGLAHRLTGACMRDRDVPVA